jgi:hypothetical protein
VKSSRPGVRCLTRTLVAAFGTTALLPAAAPRAGPQGRNPVVVRVDEGFRWLDAGIGALTALGLVALVVAFVLMARKGPTARAKGER